MLLRRARRGEEQILPDVDAEPTPVSDDLVIDLSHWNNVTSFEDVKKSVLASPLGSMSVASAPSPAKVYLDGRERGATPLELVNLVAQQKNYRTLERLCAAIADRLLSDYEAHAVWVKAAKPEPPIALPVTEVSVEVWREAGEE